MILSDIKEYFRNHKVASLSDLSLRFRVEPGAMRGILEQWIRKGRLEKLVQEGSCPSCCGCECNYELMEFYKWME